MRLLTAENNVFHMDRLPTEKIDSHMLAEEGMDNISYCVLDCRVTDNVNDQKLKKSGYEIDFLFESLVFWETFEVPTLSIEFGKFNPDGKWESRYSMLIPMDFHIMIGIEDYDELDMVPLTELNDRDMHSPVFNPITFDRINHFEMVRARHNFHSVSFAVPKLKQGQLLPIPLTDDHNPPCVIFGDKMTAIPNPLSIS